MSQIETAVLVPAKGLIVRDPHSGEPLPPEGALKPLIGYWLRRERDGDVTRRPVTKKK